MNLVVIPITEINGSALSQNVLFNVSMLRDVQADGSGSKFKVRKDNYKSRYKSTTSYDNMKIQTASYDYGTYITVTVVRIGADDVNESVLLAVDDIVYGENDPTNPNRCILRVHDRTQPRHYVVSETITSIAVKSLAASSRGESQTMTASQTAITTSLTLRDSCALYISGTLQGFIGDLTYFTITDSNTLTYSGAAFWGGEVITIIP